MPEANNVRYLKVLMSKHPAQVLTLRGFPLMNYSPKYLTEIYMAQYGDAIFVSLSWSTNMAAGK